MPPFRRRPPFSKRRTKPPPPASTMQPVQPTPITDTPGDSRRSLVNIPNTGVFPEGTRSRGQGGFDYTHIIVCDVFVEVHDSYVGNTQALSANGDILRIPSGVANYWVAVFVFVTQLPGVGRKKVVLADRRGGEGGYTEVL